jgi:hypothetical protein
VQRIASRFLLRRRGGQFTPRVNMFHAQVAPPSAVPVHYVSQADRWTPKVTALIGAPFDLRQPPLIRAVAVEGDDRATVIVVIDHLVFDWHSQAIFREEFEHLFAEFTADLPSSLPAPVQYGAFAAWERARFTGEHLEECQRYWLDHLGEFSMTRTPLRADELRYHRRGQERRGVARIDERPIPDTLDRQLQGFCVAERVTPYMVLFAAVARVLGRASRRSRVVLWLAFANRMHPATERLIGWVEQSMPVALDIDDRADDSTLVPRAREAVLGALAHVMPMVLLPCATLEIPSADRLGSDYITFDFRTEPDAGPPAPRAGFEVVSDFALILTAVQSPHGLRLRAQYCVDWFDESGIVELLHDVHSAVADLVSAPRVSSAASRRPPSVTFDDRPMAPLSSDCPV